MHVYGPIDGFGLNRSVGGFHLEISLARHADFNVQVPRIMAKREAPMPRDARRQLYLVAVLAGVDAEVLSHFVALVFDAKFHLSRAAGGVARPRRHFANSGCCSTTDQEGGRDPSRIAANRHG